MGAIGGGIWHGIKGARNSPKVSCLIISDLAQFARDWEIVRAGFISLFVR